MSIIDTINDQIRRAQLKLEYGYDRMSDEEVCYWESVIRQGEADLKRHAE